MPYVELPGVPVVQRQRRYGITSDLNARRYGDLRELGVPRTGLHPGRLPLHRL